MVVVASSNRAHSELYLNGLQRDSFLPFITDVEQRCAVHHLDSVTDYRTLAMAASGVARLTDSGLGAYLYPLGAETDANVRTLWDQLTNRSTCGPQQLQLAGRQLTVPMASELTRTARFTFAELCGQPLGAEDYLRISQVPDRPAVRGAACARVVWPRGRPADVIHGLRSRVPRYSIAARPSAWMFTSVM